MRQALHLLPLACLLLPAAAIAQQIGPLPPHMDRTLDFQSGHVQGIQPPSPGSAGVTAGSSGFDDFNRADGPLGPDWGIGDGTFEVRSNEFAPTGSGNGWALYTAATSLYDQASIEFDLLPDPQSLAYCSAVIGAGGSEYTFTKIQNNSGVGFYTHIGFYYGNGLGGYGSYGGFFSIIPVSGGRVKVYVSNAGDTMNLDIDEDFDGIYEWHYESSDLIGSGLAGLLGDGLGLGAYGGISRADNFSANGEGPQPVLAVPEILPGQFMTFDVSNLDADSLVVVLLSSLGPGPTVTPFGDIEVTQPWRQTPPFPADAAGVVNFSTTLPPGASGMTFYMQAVEMKVDDSTLLTNSLEVPIP